MILPAPGQVHGHAATCNKGKIGGIMCRMARQQACVDRTCTVQLDTSILPPSCNPTTLHEHETWVPATMPTVQPIPSRRVLCASVPLRVAQAPALLPDPRVLKVEVLRPTIKIKGIAAQVKAIADTYCRQHKLCPEKDFLCGGGLDDIVAKILPRLAQRNGYVVEVNDVISAATRCNTNVQWLATMHDSRTAMGYLSSYLKKTKVDPADVISLLSTVRKQILTSHVSKAADAGTASRTSKHLLARMHNMALGRQKLAATQCAMYLLQAKTFQTSEQFITLHVSCACDHIKHNRSVKESAAAATDRKEVNGEVEEEQAHTDVDTAERLAAWYGNTHQGTCTIAIGFTQCLVLLHGCLHYDCVSVPVPPNDSGVPNYRNFQARSCEQRQHTTIQNLVQTTSLWR